MKRVVRGGSLARLILAFLPKTGINRLYSLLSGKNVTVLRGISHAQRGLGLGLSTNSETGLRKVYRVYIGPTRVYQGVYRPTRVYHRCILASQGGYKAGY